MKILFFSYVLLSRWIAFVCSANFDDTSTPEDPKERIKRSPFQCQSYSGEDDNFNHLFTMYDRILSEPTRPIVDILTDDMKPFYDSIKTVDCVSGHCLYETRKVTPASYHITANCSNDTSQSSLDDVKNYTKFYDFNRIDKKGIRYVCNTTLCNDIRIINEEIKYSKIEEDRKLPRITEEKAKYEDYINFLKKPESSSRAPGSTIKCAKYNNHFDDAENNHMESYVENATEIDCKYNCFYSITRNTTNGRFITTEGGCKDIQFSTKIPDISQTNYSCDQSLCNTEREIFKAIMRGLIEEDKSYKYAFEYMLLRMKEEIDIMEQVYYRHNPLANVPDSEKRNDTKEDGASDTKENSIGIATTTLSFVMIYLMINYK